MNHELAKRLKDAGYPQKGEHYWWDEDGQQLYQNSTDLDFFESAWGMTPTNLMVAPTLSELIEACGVGFKELVHENGSFICRDDYMDMNENWYASPEEAVANLWLALHAHA